MHCAHEMVCPDGDAMAAAWLKDGQKVLHNCPTTSRRGPVKPTRLPTRRARTLHWPEVTSRRGKRRTYTPGSALRRVAEVSGGL
jgi:hypothetical protein